MSIFHKSVLAGAVETVKVERTKDQYRSILLQRDGTVVAINDQMAYIVQPSQQSVYNFLSFAKPDTLEKDVAISWEQIQNLVKMVPVDKQFKGALEHIDISTDQGTVLNVMFNDGKGIGRFLLRGTEPNPILKNWKKYFQGLGVDEPGQKRHVFNRKRLGAVINAIETACNYNGEFSYIVQRTTKNGYLWRCVNELTSQVVLVAFNMPATVDEIKYVGWEASLCGRRQLTRCPTKI